MYAKVFAKASVMDLITNVGSGGGGGGKEDKKKKKEESEEEEEGDMGFSLFD